jgi:hypothetical protein
MMKKKIGIVLVAAFLLAGVLLSIKRPPVPASMPANSPSMEVASEQSQTPSLNRAPRGVSLVQPASLTPTNQSVLRFIHGEEVTKLTDAQLEPYLQDSHRVAGSLLAAFRTSGDRKFLLEALEKFPNDPRVNYAALFGNEPTPEEHRRSLENFKQSDPNNALANYLSAFDYFKAGQSAQAVQELSAAATKSYWKDYSGDFIQNGEEAYRAAGYSEAEAKAAACWSLLLPDLAPLRQLGRNLGDLANTYKQAGDSASAAATLEMAVNLGQQIAAPSPQPLITTLVGMAIEKQALSAMDPTSPYGNSGQTVQDRITEIAQTRKSMQELTQKSDGLLDKMPPEDVNSYFDRLKTFGEMATLQWALEKYGQH